MPIRYQPLGIPTTSSFAVSASGAVDASTFPETASRAVITTDSAFTGPQGEPFKNIITGSIVPSPTTTTTTTEP